MILVFLGSWRNTVVVAISIPLSIFAGVAGLFMTGQTINLMTLGGLALAIGMLVDNATVVMENIHRNQTLGKPVTVAILDGSVEVIQPLTVATLCICIVFFPVRVPGRPGALPVHPARHHRRAGDAGVLRAVVHGGAGASRASSSRTSITTPTAESSGWGARLARAFDRGFDRVRNAYGRVAGGRAGPQEVRAGLLRAVLRGQRARWCRSSAPTSSRKPTSASSSCTCAPRTAIASRAPSRS